MRRSLPCWRSWCWLSLRTPWSNGFESFRVPKHRCCTKLRTCPHNGRRATDAAYCFIPSCSQAPVVVVAPNHRRCSVRKLPSRGKPWRRRKIGLSSSFAKRVLSGLFAAPVLSRKPLLLNTFAQLPFSNLSTTIGIQPVAGNSVPKRTASHAPQGLHVTSKSGGNKTECPSSKQAGQELCPNAVRPLAFSSILRLFFIRPASAWSSLISLVI